MAHDVSHFDTEVIARSHEIPVLCDFWAPWCGPCRMLGPILEQLASDAKGAWVLAKLNTETHPEPAQRFQVRGIPDVKLFHKGKVIAQFSGAQSASMVAQWLKKHLPERAAPALKEALQLIDGLKFESAVNRLREALSDLSGQELEQARYLLAKAIVWQFPSETLALLRDLPTDVAEHHELEALRFIANGFMAPPSFPTEASENRSHLLAAFGEMQSGQIEQAMYHFTEILWDHPRFADNIALLWQKSLILYLGMRHPLSKRHFNAYSGATDLAT